MKRLPALLLLAALIGAPLLVTSMPATAQTSVSISVRIGPPALPVYPQPFAPGPGYIWTPGYWAWGEFGYYWVPGAWVLAPAVGMLWTPGYWGWNGGMYWWHPGYWGPRVGFYGGINYGYGYIGVGYVGGSWRGGAFYYNRAVSNVNVTYIHNTYNETVVNTTTTVNRVSYNGGSGGTTLRATQEQAAYANERHTSPTESQVRQQQLAMNDPNQRFSTNQGRPQVVATAKPGAFSGPGAVRRNAEGNYAYRPAARDRAAYQERRAAEPRAEPAQQRREQPMQEAGVRQQAKPRPQARERGPKREAHRCRPNDPRCG